MTALVLLVLAQPAGVFDNADAFQELEKSGGLTLQGRAIKDSKFWEYRVVTETALPVAALCEHIYEWGTKGTDHPGVKLHKVLKDTPDDRIVYDQLEQPVVSNRDYALTVRRYRDPDGVCRIRFWVSNDVAPVKPDGFVRMDKLWGSWRFEPLEKGGSRLTYTLFADPGGSIPAFLVHGSQKSAAKDSVATGIKKVKEAVEGKR
ncbi:MAG: START domain-containing protein [Myxococcota bacterium]